MDDAWWRDAVLYQVYPRSFRDTNGDGIGDLPGITAGLDHVAALGVDAIWVCPFYVSPGRDFGYDIADHTAVDPAFGTLADFDALIAAAHARHLRVLVDLVAGHTSEAHAWFRASRTAREGPHADWYVWADPAPDGTAPNNWLSVFGGPAWTWEPRRRQYYLHHFLREQPALNLENPAVLDALLGVARFWLDRGVDGFRLDAVDFLTHDPLLRSNPAAPPADGAVPAKLFGLQRHAHDMLGLATPALLRRIRALTDEYPGAVTLAEVSSQADAFGRIARYTAGHDLLHMAYTLRPLRGGFDAPTLRALSAELGAHTEGWPCWCFSNHDVERAITRWGPREDPADPRFGRLLLTLLLTLRGTACIYQGEELGLPEVRLRHEDLRDPFGLAYWPEFRGRDGARTPMPWRADARHAGFSTAPAPWLPVVPAHRALAAELQEANPASLLHAWRAMLACRRAHPALRVGTMLPLPLPDPLVAFVREWEGARVLVACNLSAAPATVPAAVLAGAQPLPGAPGFVAAPARPGTAPGQAEADHHGTTLGPWGVLLAQLD